MPRYLHNIFAVLGVFVGVLMAIGIYYFFFTSIIPSASAGIRGSPKVQQIPTIGFYPWNNDPDWPTRNARLQECINLGIGIWKNDAGVKDCADNLKKYANQLENFVAQEKTD